MPLSHTSQIVEDLLNFQGLACFRSSFTMILENFDHFRWKNVQKCKFAIFWYFTKIEITQFHNDIESWNFTKLWRIVWSKIAPRHFLIIWVNFENLIFSTKNILMPNFGQKQQIFQINLWRWICLFHCWFVSFTLVEI